MAAGNATNYFFCGRVRLLSVRRSEWADRYRGDGDNNEMAIPVRIITPQLRVRQYPARTKNLNLREVQLFHGGKTVNHTWVRLLNEQYPNTNSAGTYWTWFGDDKTGYCRRAVERFHGPNGEDSDAGLGKWACRSRYYRIPTDIDVGTGIGEAESGEETQVQVEVMLLDQWFDCNAITWNNPPPHTGPAYRCTHYAILPEIQDGYETAGDVIIEAPRLVADGRPMPIYGVEMRIDLIVAPEEYEIAYRSYADGENSTLCRQMADDERIESEFSTNLDDGYTSTLAGAPYAYHGEWIPPPEEEE